MVTQLRKKKFKKNREKKRMNIEGSFLTFFQTFSCISKKGEKLSLLSREMNKCSE